jgi:putative flavoprotein involved in K+ transport
VQPFSMRGSSGSIRVAIVGAGPAGLAVSSRLARLGCPHVVFERERVGWSWRAQRWDSFRLNTPRWANRALGEQLAGRRDTFASAGALVAALEQSAERLPVAEGVEVVSARRMGPSWLLDTTRGSLAADAVVVASGFQNVPRIPRYAAALPKQIRLLHASDYRNPGALDDGVLVVGGGQSGLQIAEDLVDAGKQVYLATSRVGRLPRRFAGRDAFEWLRESGQLDLARDQADPSAIAATPPQVSGAGGGRTVSFQALASRGVTLLGRAVGLEGGRLELAADLGENVRFADDVSSFFREAWEKRARLLARGRDVVGAVDAADEPAPHLYDAQGTASFDLGAGKISTVIWATGFGPSTAWLPSDALDSRHRPQLPGLHVIGAPWLTHRSSANLYGMLSDADRLVNALARTRFSRAA